ncbi:MAG TPA: FAD-dependent oxidoreductase [Pyrinomonadaceae bacterium]|nr:FAD-dependent oxidoreductase [Pyrinomonadaceae bacterium]
MKPITVVGAGFSGLTTAYLLTKAGREVRVVEKTARAGGLIRTNRTEHGLVETAANGILNSARLEAMCADIGVPLLPTRPNGRKRFIFRGKPRQMPLSFAEALRIPVGLIGNAAKLRPQPFETIAAWGARVPGKGATEYLLIPALGGIYAGDPDRLSASLIFGRANLPDHLQTYRPQKARTRGTVAPPNGMQQLIDGLVDYLRQRGAEINFSETVPFNDSDPTVVCLSASAAAAYLAKASPRLAQELARIEMLSLVTATCFFRQEAATLKGFGCLFPLDQNFRARGVLFNDCIFEGRGPAHSETWIYGGALDPDAVNLDDEELTKTILADRTGFYQQEDRPLAVHIKRWPNALPHYSVDLERTLMKLPNPPSNIALVGNYLGRIGLAKIFERGAYVVDNVVKNWD